MNKKYLLITLTLILIFFGSSLASSGQEKDIEGSNDHPLLSRMDNFYIDEYTEFEYDSHTFYDEEDYELR